MSRVTLNGRVVADEDQWIYDWFGIDAFSPAVIRKAVEDNPAGEDLTLEINSGGGSVFAGFEMYSILKGAKCQTIAEVQSLAASAASTAMVGCSKVMLSPVAQVMIHLPSSYAEGNQEDMERERRALESITQSILNGYELKCRKKTDRAHLEALMHAESWLSAQEAVDLGLADGILFQNEDDSSTLPANIINAVGGGIRSLACNSGAPVSPATMKRKLIDLSNQRTQHLQAAEAALKANNVTEYDSEMEKVSNLNTEIDRVKTLLDEQQRQIMDKQPTGAEARDMAEERGSILMRGDAVKFSAMEVLRAMNSTTLATGTLVQPTGAGSNIADPLGNVVSSIVDQVRVTDMSGMASFLEPYVISEIAANAGKVETLAGTARAASTDPTFGVAEIKPYEINTTSYVDRNISNLSPANYYAKIQNMAMRAMRRKLASLIVNGDGQASPTFYGIKSAKNKAGNAIYASVDVSAVDVNLLDLLYFAYGSDDAMGANARLLLTKVDLKAIGALRGTNEKRRLFEIAPDAGNPNTGIIRNGGVVVPYTICSDLTSLSTATAGSAAIQTMLYGDTMNFEVGLFGDFTVRVDESVKAVERMHTILGDAMVGGNLIVDKGFVVATLPKSGT